MGVTVGGSLVLVGGGTGVKVAVGTSPVGNDWVGVGSRVLVADGVIWGNWVEPGSAVFAGDGLTHTGTVTTGMAVPTAFPRLGAVDNATNPKQ